MITIEVDQTINRPVKEVFKFMTDIERLPSYATGVKEAKWLPPGWIGIGSKFIVNSHLQVAPQGNVTFEVTNVRSNKLFSFRTIDAPLSVTASLLFEESVNGTRVAIRGESEEPKGALRFAAVLIVGKVIKQLEAELRNAKRLLEANPN